MEQGNIGKRDIMLASLDSGKIESFLAGPRDKYAAQISRDGHWMLFASDESGQPEIYLTSFPSLHGKWQISTNGGDFPRWRPDGKAIFYWLGTQLMQANLDISGSSPQVLSVHELFRANMQSSNACLVYDVTANNRILLITNEGSEQRPLSVVTNWTMGLNK